MIMANAWDAFKREMGYIYEGIGIVYENFGLKDFMIDQVKRTEGIYGPLSQKSRELVAGNYAWTGLLTLIHSVAYPESFPIFPMYLMANSIRTHQERSRYDIMYSE